MKREIILFLALLTLIGCTKRPSPSLDTYERLLKQEREQKQILVEKLQMRDLQLVMVSLGAFGIVFFVLALGGRKNGFWFSAGPSENKPNKPRDTFSRNGISNAATPSAAAPDVSVEDWYPGQNGNGCLSKKDPSSYKGKNAASNPEATPFKGVLVDGTSICTVRGGFKIWPVQKMAAILHARGIDFRIVFDESVRPRAAEADPSHLEALERFRRSNPSRCIFKFGGILQLKTALKDLEIISNDDDLPRLLAHKRRVSERRVRVYRVVVSRNKILVPSLEDNRSRLTRKVPTIKRNAEYEASSKGIATAA